MELRKQLLDLLTKIDDIGVNNRRKAVLTYVGFDYLVPRLDWNSTPIDFCSSLIDLLGEEGQAKMVAFITQLTKSPFITPNEHEELNEIQTTIAALPDSEFGTNFVLAPCESKVSPRACPSPPPAPDNFGGRDMPLAELKKRLLLGKDTALVAVQGLGGIGKTALAKKLANDLYNGQHCRTVLWADGRNRFCKV